MQRRIPVNAHRIRALTRTRLWLRRFSIAIPLFCKTQHPFIMWLRYSIPATQTVFLPGQSTLVIRKDVLFTITIMEINMYAHVFHINSNNFLSIIMPFSRLCMCKLTSIS